jgi:hypothetical protein
MQIMKAEPRLSDREGLAGRVERVTYQNADNGFCVIRVKARGHRDLVTVVGHAAVISAGEWITAAGDWTNDRTHGQQFKARFLRTSIPTSVDLCTPLVLCRTDSEQFGGFRVEAATRDDCMVKAGNIGRMGTHTANANLPARRTRAAEGEEWRDPITYKGRSLLECLNTNIGQIPDHEALALETLHMKGTLAAAINHLNNFRFHGLEYAKAKNWLEEQARNPILQSGPPEA